MYQIIKIISINIYFYELHYYSMFKKRNNTTRTIIYIIISIEGIYKDLQQAKKIKKTYLYRKE